jgi:hypothetical protein
MRPVLSRVRERAGARVCPRLRLPLTPALSPEARGSKNNARRSTCAPSGCACSRRSLGFGLLVLVWELVAMNSTTGFPTPLATWQQA